MEKAIINTKTGKAAGLPDAPIDQVQALGEGIIPIFKKKGDILECGDYWDIKLTEHLLKVLERIIDGRLRLIVRIDEMHGL